MMQKEARENNNNVKDNNNNEDLQGNELDWELWKNSKEHELLYMEDSESWRDFFALPAFRSQLNITNMVAEEGV
jgi:hypothetical protein